MARHIMAVCVVCLLCADRLPCQQHVEGIFAADAAGEHTQLEYQPLNADVFQRTDLPRKSVVEQSVDGRQYARHRHKRHAGHAHETSTAPQRPEVTENFLQRIFDEYGQEDGTIRIGDFQRMLQRLGLHQLVQQKLSNEGIVNETCISDTTLVHHIQPHNLNHQSHNHHHHKAHVNCTQSTNNTDNIAPCAEMNFEHDSDKHAHGGDSNNYTLSTTDVFNLCPVLLYQLASPLDSRRAGCIDDAVLADIEDHGTTQLIAKKEDIMYVWIYAFISVFSCGLLGLLGMAIIPFMDSRYYKHIIQYLVALAVGTMTGDALLHLLPHSLIGQSEQNMIFKGLTCMGGIIFFYITEHGLTMISEWRRRIAKTDASQPTRAKVVRDPESSVNNSVAGDKVCKSKYSSYPYCYDEIALETKNDLHLPTAKHKVHANNIAETRDVGNNVERKRNGKTDAEASDAVAQSLLPVWNAGDAYHNHHQHHQHVTDSNTVATDLDGNAVGDGIAAVTTATTVNGHGNNTKDKMNNDTVTVILREHESTHHGHSHKHGHVHSPPESLSAVAWMIIMGDGLHNFTDGMAIGAAFAENIAGGFSTSLAVFCHELPHELGDFAILIKAGMSVKSAVYYNLLTGVLSFIGMIFGIVFGQSPEAAQWMFAAASGLFIYISLVDMMPELSSAHKTVEQFILQVLGMSTGVLIMLLIAIFEGDLMNVFSSSSTAAGH